MKKLSILLWCLLVCQFTFGAQNEVAELAQRGQSASVGLACRGPRGGYFGTGTIIRKDGVILTSSTVLPPGSSDIRVTLADGRVLWANLLLVDTKLELALAKVDGVELPFVPLGTSAESHVGERVLTLGNAFDTAAGEGRVSVGAGILSGKFALTERRSESTYIGEVLETDAPLNPGSDGGALLDASGSVIGILSLNYSAMRFLGTAVPIDAVRSRIEETVGPVPSGSGTRALAVPKHVLDRWQRRLVAIRCERKKDIELSNLDMAGLFERWRLQRLREQVPEMFKRPAGTVTGVCIDAGGLILTSRYNVAGELTKVEARDVSGTWRPCSLLAVGDVDDLALLRAEGGDWEAAAFAEQDRVALGRAVFVLGRSPDPASVTATGGIVSATRRNNGRFFQHDAAMNPGNSGGAVVDREGRLLGIAVYVGHMWPEWSLNSGIGFAVRSDQAVKALSFLKKGTAVPYPDLPFLGVSILRRGVVNGKIVVDVMPGSAAEKGGLVSGDHIVKVGDYAVATWLDLRRAVSTYKVGESLSITVKRKKGEQKLTIVLAARPKRR